MTDDAKPEEDQTISHQHQRWFEHFKEIDAEIGRLCLTCGVRILEPGVIERVLHNDANVCSKPNPRAFERLRSLLMMHYSVRDRAVVAMGEKETMGLINVLVERLRTRFGEQLGG
jgi:hypothetical protein